MEIKHKVIPLIFKVSLLTCNSTQAIQLKYDGNIIYKPRIINTTNLGADPDDKKSLARQLVSANEFDIKKFIPK
jgi:hypothetical protein